MQHKLIEVKYTVCQPEELFKGQQILIERAKEAVGNAYAPFSHFYVGAAVELENGEIITGSNQENQAFPSGLCAERVALFYANSQYPDVPVRAIAIAAFTSGGYLTTPIAPCGACRQVMLESEIRFDKDITVLLYGTEGVYMLENVKQMMPLNFELQCDCKKQFEK